MKTKKVLEFPTWKVITSRGEVYKVKARTPREFASKVQRMLHRLPWEKNARVIMPNGRATFVLGYWMKSRGVY